MDFPLLVLLFVSFLGLATGTPIGVGGRLGYIQPYAYRPVYSYAVPRLYGSAFLNRSPYAPGPLYSPVSPYSSSYGAASTRKYGRKGGNGCCAEITGTGGSATAGPGIGIGILGVGIGIGGDAAGGSGIGPTVLSGESEGPPLYQASRSVNGLNTVVPSRGRVLPGANMIVPRAGRVLPGANMIVSRAERVLPSAGVTISGLPWLQPLSVGISRKILQVPQPIILSNYRRY